MKSRKEFKEVYKPFVELFLKQTKHLENDVKHLEYSLSSPHFTDWD